VQRSSLLSRFFGTTLLFRVTALNAHEEWILQLQLVITLRFDPDFAFSAALPLGGDFSFGFVVKKPSSRPCCLAFKNFCNFSAPFFTRSSLQSGSIERTCGLAKNLLEPFLGHKELH